MMKYLRNFLKKINNPHLYIEVGEPLPNDGTFSDFTKSTLRGIEVTKISPTNQKEINKNLPLAIGSLKNSSIPTLTSDNSGFYILQSILPTLGDELRSVVAFLQFPNWHQRVIYMIT
jgi:hypothetical protein